MEDDEERKETRPESWKTVMLFSMFGFLSYLMFSVTVSSAEEFLSGHTGSTSTVWLVLYIPTVILPPFITYIFDRVPPLVFILILFPINASALVCLLLAGTRVWLKYLAICLIGCGIIADVTAISLTAYFDKITVTAYSVGTGLGYVTSPLYVTALTSWIHISYKIAISIVIVVQPFIYLLCYCLLENRREKARMGYQSVTDKDPKEAKLSGSHQYLTVSEKLRTALDISPNVLQIVFGILSHDFVLSGITTTLAFSNSPFSPVDHYKYYLIMSFIGLFIGRSYLGLADYIKPGLSDKIRLKRHTWLLGVISAGHIIILILASLYRFLPNVWYVLVLVFSVGIFSEATFSNITLVFGEIQDKRKREYAMGLAAFGLYLGALIGVIVAAPVEKLLVNHCLSFANETATCLTREL